jgi:hypothetical protein
MLDSRVGESSLMDLSASMPGEVRRLEARDRGFAGGRF